MGDSTARDAIERWIAGHLPACSIDELKVLAVRIERMSRARSDYGGLDLRKDRRDMILEGALETVDRGFYFDALYVFENDPTFADIRSRRRVEAFIDASDDDITGEFKPVKVCDQCGVRIGDAMHDFDCTYLKAAHNGPPATWAAELGAPELEIAIARTDSAEFPNTMDAPCGDCAALPGTLHRSGCEWTIVVPVPETECA